MGKTERVSDRGEMWAGQCSLTADPWRKVTELPDINQAMLLSPQGQNLHTVYADFSF